MRLGVLQAASASERPARYTCTCTGGFESVTTAVLLSFSPLGGDPLRRPSLPRSRFLFARRAVVVARRRCRPRGGDEQVLEICAHFGGLQAARTEMMGLFVYDLGPIDEEKVGVLST